MPRHLKKHRHFCRKSLAPDPLVNPGNPPHRHQARPPARPARSHHRMVVVAARPPGPSSPCPSQACKPQKKNATVMLGNAAGAEPEPDGDLKIELLKTDLANLLATARANR